MYRDNDYKKLINSTRWINLRRAVLRERPLCVECKRAGRYTPATEVHHIKPVTFGAGYAEKERLCYDAANLMPLCHECHAALHRAMGKNGKGARQERAAEALEHFRRRFFGQ